MVFFLIFPDLICSIFDFHSPACQQLWALTMTGIQVPEMGDVKDVVTLTCTYDMGRTKLNSVKWYKDGSEFFRWVFSPEFLILSPCRLLGDPISISNQNSRGIEIRTSFPISRYSPMMFPSIMTFPVDGVHLKQDQQYNCNKHICAVVLDSLKRRSTGSYRCEISGDAPEFHVVHETANLTIAGKREIEC